MNKSCDDGAETSGLLPLRGPLLMSCIDNRFLGWYYFYS